MDKTIILIDDDEDDIDLMVEAIAEFDPTINCITFNDPRKAIHTLLGKGRAIPTYIFLDINMPVLPGDICLRVIRSTPEFSDVPVAIISTFMSDEESKRLYTLGANFALQKPYSIQGYFEILKCIFLTNLDNAVVSEL
ncbi:MAG: response regulator [Chryseolinea sp.]